MWPAVGPEDQVGCEPGLVCFAPQQASDVPGMCVVDVPRPKVGKKGDSCGGKTSTSCVLVGHCLTFVCLTACITAAAPTNQGPHEAGLLCCCIDSLIKV